MSQAMIELLLENQMGLSAKTVGTQTITRAIQTRMTLCGLNDSQAYLSYLKTTETEWDKLIEAVVVPETWFFRNQASFTFLSQYVKSQWLPQHQADKLRVLSVPCSTGEEPYSIAITLIESGLAAAQFHIDAVDINQVALSQAQQGIYTQTAFRGQTQATVLASYFDQTPTGYQIHSSLQHSVHFKKGNLLDSHFLLNVAPYDIIFCRNLLIYWEKSAKIIGISHLDRLLSDRGLLFVGHAERSYFCDYGFEQIRQAGVFACSKRSRTGPNTPTKPSLTHLPKPINQLNKTASLFKKSIGSVTSALNKPKRTQIVNSTHLAEYQLPKNQCNPAEELLSIAQQSADQGQLETALKLCEQYLAKQSDDIQAHFLMGIICQALGWNNKAEEHFNKTVYLKPNHADALNHLASLFEYRGNQDQARHLRQRIQRIRQKESERYE